MPFIKTNPTMYAARATLTCIKPHTMHALFYVCEPITRHARCCCCLPPHYSSHLLLPTTPLQQPPAAAYHPTTAATCCCLPPHYSSHLLHYSDRVGQVVVIACAAAAARAHDESSATYQITDVGGEGGDLTSKQQ
jgi:hypothetical protein